MSVNSVIIAIAAIVGPKGRIKVREWLPGPIPNSVRMALAGVELDGGPDGPAVDPEWGEPGLTPAENVYAWNSFAVLTMVTGDPAAPANAIQPWARAHCQLRYIAGTDVEGVVPALRRHLDEHGFEDVQILPPPPDNAAGFPASRTDLDDPWAIRVLRSIERTSGRKPAILPQMGGSICNDVFTDILGLPSIWIPHSYASCLQHAPDLHGSARGGRLDRLAKVVYQGAAATPGRTGDDRVAHFQHPLLHQERRNRPAPDVQVRFQDHPLG